MLVFVYSMDSCILLFGIYNYGSGCQDRDKAFGLPTGPQMWEIL